MLGSWASLLGLVWAEALVQVLVMVLVMVWVTTTEQGLALVLEMGLVPGLARELEQELGLGLVRELEQGLALVLEQELVLGLARELEQGLVLGLVSELEQELGIYCFETPRCDSLPRPRRRHSHCLMPECSKQASHRCCRRCTSYLKSN